MEQTPVSQSASEAPPAMQPPLHHANRLIIPIIVGFLLIFFAGLIAGYMIWGTKKPDDSSEKQVAVISPSAGVPTPIETKDIFNAEFAFRQFDLTDKLIDTQEYPDSLTSMDNGDLVSMRCTERLSCDSENCTYTPEDALPQSLPVKVEDKKVMASISNANSLLLNEASTSGSRVKSVDQATFCEAEDGKRIIEYKTSGGGGGAGSIDYIGLLDSENNVTKIGEISEDTAYFGCYDPLQLTTAGILYYRCGGGDGLAGSASLYSIDLEAKIINRIVKCTVVSDYSGNATTNCQ